MVCIRGGCLLIQIQGPPPPPPPPRDDTLRAKWEPHMVRPHHAARKRRWLLEKLADIACDRSQYLRRLRKMHPWTQWRPIYQPCTCTSCVPILLSRPSCQCSEPSIIVSCNHPGTGVNNQDTVRTCTSFKSGKRQISWREKLLKVFHVKCGNYWIWSAWTLDWQQGQTDMLADMLVRHVWCERHNRNAQVQHKFVLLSWRCLALVWKHH